MTVIFSQMEPLASARPGHATAAAHASDKGWAAFLENVAACSRDVMETTAVQHRTR